MFGGQATRAASTWATRALASMQPESRLPTQDELDAHAWAVLGASPAEQPQADELPALLSAEYPPDEIILMLHNAVQAAQCPGNA